MDSVILGAQIRHLGKMFCFLGNAKTEGLFCFPTKWV